MKRWIGIALVMAALAGCGGGGGRSEPPEPPAFDLTGYWVTTEIDCDVFSADLPQLELARFDAELEDDLLASEARVVQRGNDLEIIDLETGSQADGMISGDQVRYVYSEQRSLGGLESSIYVETEGTALDADTIVGTQEADWTLTVQGETITGGALCTGRLMRRDMIRVPLPES